MTGVMHSCGLTPPCSYTVPATNVAMPGATAIRTVAVPEPRHGAARCDCTVGEAAGSTFLHRLVLREVVRQLHLGQLAREVEPAVVGDDNDLAPACVEQPGDPFARATGPHRPAARAAWPAACGPARRCRRARSRRGPPGLPCRHPGAPGSPRRQADARSPAIVRSGPPAFDAGARPLPAKRRAATGETAGFAVEVIVGSAVSRGGR